MKCPRCEMNHSWSWTPNGKYEPDWGECDDESTGAGEFTESVPCDELHISADSKLKCKGCGGTEFTVAEAPYHTYIICPKCKWEATVHEG